jgi:hypothetical protein
MVALDDEVLIHQINKEGCFHCYVASRSLLQVYVYVHVYEGQPVQ